MGSNPAGRASFIKGLPFGSSFLFKMFGGEMCLSSNQSPPTRLEFRSWLQAIRVPRMERIYLIYAYVKSAQADLTPKQIKTLAQLMKDIENG